MNKKTGFTLVEVLVAIVILGVGLLGLAALQTASLKNTQTANLRVQATFLADNLIDRIKSNKEGAQAGSYLVTEAPSMGASNCTTTACTPEDMAKMDLINWYRRADATLGTTATEIDPATAPSAATISCGAGLTACPKGSLYTITLFWAERLTREEDQKSGETGAKSYDGFAIKTSITEFIL